MLFFDFEAIFLFFSAPIAAISIELSSAGICLGEMGT